jgi:methylated-DNA-[protein]-cysteine S-methyltransferase
MKNVFFYETEIGKIMIAENGTAITNLYFRDEPDISDDVIIKETELLKEAAKQLTEYFEGRRKSFDLPLSPTGTEFQMKCWKALQEIPYGETRTYGEIAEKIGNPKACRAVGLSNNRNPISIVIPCHRVIGANGKLVGYAGGLNVKEYLLNLEKENAKN